MVLFSQISHGVSYDLKTIGEDSVKKRWRHPRAVQHGALNPTLCNNKDSLYATLQDRSSKQHCGILLLLYVKGILYATLQDPQSCP